MPPRECPTVWREFNAMSPDATTYGVRMRALGPVASGNPYELPDGWEPVSEGVLRTAEARTLEALTSEVERHSASARTPVEEYFDPEGDHAGATFNTVNRAAAAWLVVAPADLLAVSLLSVEVRPRQVRLLLDDGPKRNSVNAALAAVPRDVSLFEFSSGTRGTALILARLEELYEELRTTPEPTSRSWVFASKLVARKLPYLMPVRDNVVSEYLAGSPLSSSGGPGHFQMDLQVFAYLLSAPEIRSLLRDVAGRLRRTYGVSFEAVPDLRILDVVLWNAGIDSGPGPRGLVTGGSPRA